MRAVVCSPGPEFSVMDVYRGWVSGLRECGVQVVEFNLHDRMSLYSEVTIERDGETRRAFSTEAAVECVFHDLQGVLYRTWPDLIVMVSGFFFDERLFDFIRAARPHRTVMIHTESPYEDDRQLKLATHVDLNVLNDPTNIDQYPDGTVYVPHAYDPKVHHPNKSGPVEFDFSFCGTGYPSRIAYLEEALKDPPAGCRVGLAGNWEALDADSPLHRFLLHQQGHCLDNDQTAELYRMSDMTVNLYRREANRDDLIDGWAMGPREVEAAACGTFFARDPRGEGDELFPMLPKVTSPDELADVIAWSMTHPTERQAAADAARAAVSDRTFAHNAERLLAALSV